MLLMAGCVVKWKEALSSALCETFENVDCMINLSEKVVSIEESITIFAHLEHDPSFPGGCEKV
jgi:hypothetical protein